MREVPEVLFVCIHNAGRSQMAAAYLDHLAEGRVLVRSAGSAPAGSVNPAVVAALAEIGLDISRELPKPLTDEVVRASAYQKLGSSGSSARRCGRRGRPGRFQVAELTPSSDLQPEEQAHPLRRAPPGKRSPSRRHSWHRRT